MDYRLLSMDCYRYQNIGFGILNIESITDTPKKRIPRSP